MSETVAPLSPPTPSVALSAAPSPRRGAGVRPFEGFGVVFQWGLRRGFSAHRFRWAAAITIGIAVLLGLLISGDPDPVSQLWLHLDDSILAVAVPLIALALAGSGYAEEIQEQTLLYHLVRLVSRATVYLGRFAAGVLPCAVGAAAVALAMTLASGVRLAFLTYLQIAAVAAIGAVVVGSVYFALGALFRRGLVAGLVYTFVVEGLCQFLPGAVQDLSLMHHVRSLLHRLTDADFASMSISVRAAIEQQKHDAAHGSGAISLIVRRAAELWSSTPKALTVCAAVLAGALLLGVRAVKRRDFALKE